jgi:hypothetical protein
MSHRVPLRLFAIGAFGLLFSASSAYGFVQPPQIEELARESELIVVARVESVSGKAGDDDRRAKALVSEVWQGPKVATVEFHASPAWVCDIAGAEPGETILLFLTDNRNGCWRIAWSGRGRMPVKAMDGRDCATPFMDVIFPKETASTPVPEKENHGFDRAYDLLAVKKLVRKAIDARK